MVQFGCCLSAGSFVPQVQNEESSRTEELSDIKNQIYMLGENGFNFIELTVGLPVNLSEENYHQFKKIVKQAGISVPVFNSFIPAHLSLTGEEVDYDKIENFLQLAMRRICGVGGKYIIFGSGSARGIKKGFSRGRGKEQIKSFLKICNRYAQKYDLKIAIEPLNSKETNVINTVKEALELVEGINLTNIKILADSYHMFMENEDFTILKKAAEHLIHVHIADNNRNYPGQDITNGVDFPSFFKELKQINYKGGISLECRFTELKHESKKSLNYIKKIWDNC